jgi:hypothetical protein
MRELRITIVSFLAALMVSGLLLGQTITGKIMGVVTDKEGTTLPGVSVLGTSSSLIAQATAITDSTGTYRLLALPPGIYKITFSLSGFATVVQENIRLLPEQTLAVNIQMGIAALETEVTVTAKAPLIDVKSTSQGMTVDKKTFDSLPKGRNFDSLTTLVPGVVNERALGGTSVDGASGLENMYYVDGMNTGDPFRGDLQQQVAYDFVDEVQVTSSGYQAEFGGSLGGVVNVITRSGGNELHGTVVGYFEGSALTGKERDTLRLNPYDATKAEYVNYQDLYGKDKVTRWEAGFDLGGYILKDRLWFYLSALPVFKDTTRKIEWEQGGSSSYTEQYRWYNFLGKITANPIKSLRLSASFVSNTSTQSGSLPTRDGSGDPSFPYSEVGFDYPSYTGSLVGNLILGNNLLIDARAGYFMINTTNQKLLPPDAYYSFGGDTNAIYPDLVERYPDYIRPVGFENYPSDFNLVTKDLYYTRTSVGADLTYYLRLGGEHAIKAGFQWTRLFNKLDQSIFYDSFQFQWGQSYSIPGHEDEPYMGKYGVYSVQRAETPEGPDEGQYGKTSTSNLAFYLQDSWSPIEKLTLNFGIRAERENIPSYSTDPQYAGSVLTWGFGDKLAPRAGVIYDVFGDASLKIFGSFGLFYDMSKMNLATYYGVWRTIVRWYTLDDPEWWTYGDGNYPGSLINVFDWGYGGAFDTTDKNMKPMSQTEYSFGIEKKLAEQISATARIVKKHLRYAIEDMGITSESEEIWWIGNPGYGVTLTQKNGGQWDDKFPDTPRAKREYIAVNFALDKHFSNNWMAGFSYTWSHLSGNYSGLAASQAYQLLPNTNENFDFWYQTWDAKMRPLDGPLWTDRPHVAKMYGSYTFNFGLTVGVFSQASSGVPISRKIYVPYPYWADGIFTDGRTPFRWTTNFSIQYTMRLGKNALNFSLDVDNLFDANTAERVYDRMNRGSIFVSDDTLLSGTFDYTNQYVPDARFLMAREFTAPRSARLRIRFTF